MAFQPGADPLGWIVNGVLGQVVRIGPHEWAALVRFGVDRFAFPVGGNEERAESRSSGTSIVVDDGGEAAFGLLHGAGDDDLVGLALVEGVHEGEEQGVDGGLCGAAGGGDG